jgi:hypothetical protein
MKHPFTEIAVHISRTLPQEADQLRMQAFPGNYPDGSTADQFDHRSMHVYITIAGHIAAYIRMTPGPDAVFRSWTKGTSALPNDDRTMDIGRILVSPRYQGWGLAKLVMLESLLHTSAWGLDKINGTYEPENELMKTLVGKLGFSDCGEQLWETESGEVSVWVQPTTCAISPELVALWQKERSNAYRRIYEHFKKHQYI